MPAFSDTCYVLELIGYTGVLATKLVALRECVSARSANPAIESRHFFGIQLSAVRVPALAFFSSALCALCQDLVLVEKSQDTPQHLRVHPRSHQPRLRILLAR